MRKRFVNIVLALASVLITFAVLELVSRAYAYFTTPTIRDMQLAFAEDFTVPFSYGTPRPHVNLELREYFPSGKNIEEPVWVRSNRFGLRMREVSLEKPTGVTRIACLGDSSTFGWMIAEEEAYPPVLETLLNQNSSQPYEVLNFGVPGYTSFHGRYHYFRRVKEFAPDIVTLAFGFNDSFEFLFEEKNFFAELEKAGLIEGLSPIPLFFYDHSALAKWVMKRLKYPAQQKLIALHRERSQRQTWQPKVSQSDFQENIRVIVEDARASGAECVLLNLDLPNSWVKKPLEALSRSLSLPLIDVHTMFRSQSRLRDPQPEFQLAASGTRADSAPYSILLRVWVPASTPVTGPVSVMGNHPALGNYAPNTIPLFDDGTQGDEKPNDRVWSRRFDFDAPTQLDFSFAHSGPAGHFSANESDDVFHSLRAMRHYHTVDLTEFGPGTLWISPVYEIEQNPYQHLMVPADAMHPNAEGQRLLAKRLVETITAVTSDE